VLSEQLIKRTDKVWAEASLVWIVIGSAIGTGAANRLNPALDKLLASGVNVAAMVEPALRVAMVWVAPVLASVVIVPMAKYSLALLGTLVVNAKAVVAPAVATVAVAADA